MLSSFISYEYWFTYLCAKQCFMKKITSVILTLVILTMGSISCSNQQKKAAKPELTKVWETEAIFKVPESVCYDPAEKMLYISNINGKPLDKDTNGFISKCGLDGKVISFEWATGLHAPKGMGIAGEKFYVSDIDRVAEIDLKTGEITKFFEVAGSGFLNDIAIDGEGNVYISDMMDTKIYRISADTLVLWLDDPILTRPNGLFVMDDYLMIGCKKIMKASLQDRALEEWLLETGSIDGLESTGDEGFLFSDWQGNVYLVDGEKNIEKLLDLTGENKNAADIEFIPSEKLLLVPTFGANSVIAYKLNR